MKLPASFVLASIFLASSVSSLPLRRRVRTEKVIPLNGAGLAANAAADVAGAVYFITNEKDANFIVSADIGADGKLTLRQAVNTGGTGIHGDDGGANAAPSLFSAGSVRVSQNAGLVATVNSLSNTLSLFSVDENDPALLTQVGATIGSGGEFPVSVAFNSKGDQLCALNGGEVNTVSCFKVDKNDGLTPISGTNRPLGLKQTTAAKGEDGSVSQILFSEDDKQLFASVKGIQAGKDGNKDDQAGFVAQFDVNNDGSLTENLVSLKPPSAGLAPFGMAVIPGKKALLVTDPAVGFDIFNFEDATQKVKVAVSAVKVDNQAATGFASFSKKIGNFFLSDFGKGTITEVNVDDNLNGKVVQTYDQGAKSSVIDSDIATVGNKDFLYVLAAGDTAIDVLSLDAPGKAKNLQKLDFSGAAKDNGLTISASNVQGMAAFVKNGNNNNNNNNNQNDNKNNNNDQNNKDNKDDQNKDNKDNQNKDDQNKDNQDQKQAAKDPKQQDPKQQDPKQQANNQQPAEPAKDPKEQAPGAPPKAPNAEKQK